MLKVLNKLNNIDTVKICTKPNPSICMEECITILKSI